MATVSLSRIAFGVGLTLFVALLFIGFVVPHSAESASGWGAALAKSMIVAAIGSTVLVGFIALCVAGAWVWFRTMVALGHVPRWSLGWVFNSVGLSDKGKAARQWLLRIYGLIVVMGIIVYALQHQGLL